MKRLALLILLPLAASCSDEDQPPPVGGDVDAHGCKASAGYSWCEKTTRCERPWELAAANGFDKSREAFDTFCKGGS